MSLTKLLSTEDILSEYSLIMDIEGSEADILFNDPESLKNCTTIIAELEECANASVVDQVQQIVNLGFTIKRQKNNIIYATKLLR